jgi:hypothetical protein
MKRIILILSILAILPICMFAEKTGELGIGGAMYFKSPVLLGQSIDKDKLNVNQFVFGGDVRYKLGWFQAEGLLFCAAGDVSGLNMYLDAGACLDVSIFRLSIGAGPNITWNFNNTPLIQTGLNAKIGADIKLDNISFGMSYIMALTNNNGINIQSSSGLLGIQVLFWM